MLSLTNDAFAATSTGRDMQYVLSLPPSVRCSVMRQLVTWPRCTIVTLVRLWFIRAVSNMLSCCRHSGVSSTFSKVFVCSVFVDAASTYPDGVRNYSYSLLLAFVCGTVGQHPT